MSISELNTILELNTSTCKMSIDNDKVLHNYYLNLNIRAAQISEGLITIEEALSLIRDSNLFIK